MEARQFICSTDGCGKSFARKEHLARHTKAAHDPGSVLICRVCQREFNRNDSLQRHLARHGDVYKPSPSGRSKRACIACRAGKTKCDGNDTCSTCMKRGIDCTYREQDVVVSQEGASAEGGRSKETRSLSSRRSVSEDEDVDMISPTQPAKNTLTSHEPAIGASPQQYNPNTTLKLPGPSGLIDWSSTIIRPEADLPANTARTPADPTSSKYLEVYFSSFHHRWPIIHRPSFEQGDEQTLVVSSVKMIGAWLLGSEESKSFAFTWHHALMEQLLPRLLSHPNVAHHWLLMLMLYRNEAAISGAIMLRNILLAALREVDFFKLETAWVDERPGYFAPMALVKNGSRQRLALYLFKIDAYLGVVRNQPANIMAQELHFSLPATFAQYNADGLHLWEERQVSEPAHRNATSISSLISQDPTDTANEMLIEDIQTCIYATQSVIWSTCLNKDHAAKGVQKEALKVKLDVLKAQVDAIIKQSTEDIEVGQKPYLLLRHYFGFEDHSLPNWQAIVQARVLSLLFDTTMLYYLFSLQTCDISILTHLAKDRRLSLVEELSTVHRAAREDRRVAGKMWILSPSARRALCHATEVLVMHQSLTAHSASPGVNTPTLGTLDPAAHIALSFSVLVVWTYSTLQISGCNMCASGAERATELMHWMIPGEQAARERKAWIEGETGGRVQIQGVELCGCGVERVVAMFGVYLPVGWDVAEGIAPGIFRRGV